MTPAATSSQETSLAPRKLIRFADQVDATYVNRVAPPARGQVTFANLKFGILFALKLVYYVGLRADYRRPFWRTIRKALRRGQIDAAFGVGFIAHHLIEFSREAVRGEQNASFYSALRKRQEKALARARSPASALREPV